MNPKRIFSKLRWVTAHDFSDAEIVESALIEEGAPADHCEVCSSSPYWCRPMAINLVVRYQMSIHALQIQGGWVWLANEIGRRLLFNFKTKDTHDL